MKRLVLISVLVFAAVAWAQVNGIPASVTSTNGNFRVAVANPRPSVTSMGPFGYSLPRQVPIGPPPCSGVGINPAAPPCVIGPPMGQHHHRGPYPYYGGAYYYPYAYDYGYDGNYMPPQPPPAPPEPQPTGPAPTIFDRSGNGYNSVYAPPAREPMPQPTTQQPPPSVEEPETVTLVFRDGHKLDIQNYAIMGETLYDLTPGHLKKKIALTDLDLAATQKLNDERGVEFTLPKKHA